MCRAAERRRSLLTDSDASAAADEGGPGWRESGLLLAVWGVLAAAMLGTASALSA